MIEDVTAVNRLIRGLGQGKGSKIKHVQIPPTIRDGQNGDMNICRGVLYIKDNNEWHEFIKKPNFQVKQIGMGDNDEEPQLELKYDGVTEIVQDIRTLAFKVNQIIELLKLDVK